MNNRVTRYLGASAATAIMLATLAACSAVPEDRIGTVLEESTFSDQTVAPQPPVVESDPAPAPAQTSGEQTIAEACMQMLGPLQEANGKLAQLQQTVGSNPQAAVDGYTAIADMLTSFAGSVSNSQVRESATGAANDAIYLRDAVSVVYVDGNANATNDAITASSTFWESYGALLKLCTS